MKTGIKNAMLGVSVFHIAIGLIMLIWPDTACLIACYILGAVGVVYGLVEGIQYLRTRDLALPAGSLFAGIFSLLIGLLFILKAKTVTGMLVAVLGILVIADSAVKIRYTLQLKRVGVTAWKGYLIGAVAALLFGLVMLLDPFGSAKAMIICAGIFLILDGLYNLWLLLQVKRFVKAVEG